jgi:ubiquinone/menaquinone biosynthesis C-methylase UbiE
MIKQEIAADRDVDKLYADMRGRYGVHNARANGYLYEGYFRREQKILFSLLNPEADVLVDVACGSGLMVEPLISKRRLVVGLDFNADACVAARGNGLHVVRGDAFGLPFADATVDEIVTCQFFNQQQPLAVRQFVVESARVLRPGGRVIMVWRNGTAWVHRLALACFSFVDRLRRLPSFPYENHSFERIGTYADEAGLIVVSQAVSFPPFGWHSSATDEWLAGIIGASNICALEKSIK